MPTQEQRDYAARCERFDNAMRHKMRQCLCNADPRIYLWLGGSFALLALPLILDWIFSP